MASCSACMALAVSSNSSLVKRAAFFCRNLSVVFSNCSPSLLASANALAAISSLACVMESISICSTSSSVRPYCGFTSILCSTPLLSSFAETVRIPSALIKKLTSTFGNPAGIPGIPARLNSASFLLSATRSLSPWNTLMRILACPSTCVVYCLEALVGIFAFRGINTSISPPEVSIPRLSGVISNSKVSLLFPAKISACMAAPRATTSSGLTVSLTGWLKNVLTDSFTNGTLVLPPTITTACISVILRLASFNALRQLLIVLSTSG